MYPNQRNHEQIAADRRRKALYETALAQAETDFARVEEARVRAISHLKDLGTDPDDIGHDSAVRSLQAMKSALIQLIRALRKVLGK